MNECTYCGKAFSHEGCSIYVEGKLIQSFCSIGCYGKFYKKVTRILKKMTREELLSFIKKGEI